MKKIDLLGLAFGNFKRRKTRSILTVLGVVIGTASIVTMTSLGIAMNRTFQEQFDSMGSLTTITVYAGYDGTTGKRKTLDDETVAALQELEHVTAVSPEMELGGKMICGKYVTYTNIRGVDPAIYAKLGLKPEQGELLTEEDLMTGKSIPCMFGADVANSFYDPKGSGMYYGGMVMEDGGEEPQALVDPMDETKRIKFTFDSSYGENYPGMDTSRPRAKLYTVQPTAVLQAGGDSSYSVYVTLETAKKLKKEQLKYENSLSDGSSGGGASLREALSSYDQIKVITDDLNHTTDVTAEIKALGYEAWDDAEWILQSQEQSRMIQMILAGIGSISLLVAAIGITNTMIMSIYERTREIGVMKVIGCYLKDIRAMFLMEAGFIGLFGGIIGLGLSYLLSVILNTFAAGGGGILGGAGTKLSVIPWWLAILAIGFAVLIGLISGFLPARRAMRLSALEAIRNGN
jgi:putative ABC transport system permease protein